MANKDQESHDIPDDSLELNKETLQDLDLEPGDAENVKGGTLLIQSGGTLFTKTCLGGSIRGSGSISVAAPTAPTAAACFG